MFFSSSSGNGKKKPQLQEKIKMIDGTSSNMHHVRLLIGVEEKAMWSSLNKTTSSPEDVNVSRINETGPLYNEDEYIFDRTDVRAIFITLYTIVFCCCFFGKYIKT